MMISYNKNIRAFLFLAMIITCSCDLHAQVIWDFDQPNALNARGGSEQLLYHSAKKHMEIVDGFRGKALRTDGYSTWLTGDLQKELKQPAISGIFALESFPTDTAAFFALQDDEEQNGISLCADRFGEVLLGILYDGKYTYKSTGQHIKRFEWISLGLSSSNGNARLWVNGKSIDITDPSLGKVGLVHLLIGRDAREKKIGPYLTTAINGLIEEIKIYNREIKPADLEIHSSLATHKKPVLAIPAIRFQDDFNRPKYHLLPAANWTNETHGLLFYKGKYHIFNQKDASNLLLAQINWGHFSSPDLLHWTEHKPALTPEKGYDQNGIWSGHVVLNDQGVPTISYTAGGDKMGIGIAYPKDDNLIEWEKYSGNPVIPGQPEGYTRSDLRDTYVWKEGSKWYMIVGFGIEDGHGPRGTVLLYSSPDLKKWEFLHTLFEGNPAVDNSGIFWEMPIFRKIGDRYILLVNKVPNKGVPARALYWVGDFKNERFIPDNAKPQNLEVINRLLSPSLAEDEQGRFTTIAIIPDEIGAKAAYEHGWTHLYSIPRTWKLRNGKIWQSPHPALETLRGKETTLSDQLVKSDTPLLITENDRQSEVKLTFIPNQTKAFGFILHRNPDGTEFTKIYYDTERKEMVIDQGQSSLSEHIPLGVKRDHYEINPNEPLTLHLFIDGSVIELFINDQDALTTRIFPSKEGSKELSFFVKGDPLTIKGKTWEINPTLIKQDF